MCKLFGKRPVSHGGDTQRVEDDDVLSPFHSTVTRRIQIIAVGFHLSIRQNEEHYYYHHKKTMF